MAKLGLLLLIVACGGDKDGVIDAPAVGPEANCFDGLDDNSDGRADCADPTCASVVACVPAVPTGWTGYYVFAEGALGSAPACAAPYSDAQPAAYDELLAPNATCTTCGCDAAIMGVCATNGGMATVMTATWMFEAVACTGTSNATGCTGNDACEPTPTAPFAGMCIRSDGDMPCPSGPFHDHHLVHTSFTDTRGCNSCSCGIAVGTTCTPSGGGASGGATPTGPITYCCQP